MRAPFTECVRWPCEIILVYMYIPISRCMELFYYYYSVNSMELPAGNSWYRFTCGRTIQLIVSRTASSIDFILIWLFIVNSITYSFYMHRTACVWWNTVHYSSIQNSISIANTYVVADHNPKILFVVERKQRPQAQIPSHTQRTADMMNWRLSMTMARDSITGMPLLRNWLLLVHRTQGNKSIYVSYRVAIWAN